MSRAFVKDLEGLESGDELPERVVSPHRNLVTAEGLVQINEEVRRLRQELSEARAAEDRPAVARIERDLRYWTQRQGSAEVVPAPTDTETVRFGSRVVLAAEGGRRVAFRIVGEDEADPAQERISYVSPLARALIGSRVGDLIEFAGAPAEIEEIRC